MPDHRGSRFALEVLFLLALAVGLTLADLQPLEIGAVMLLGWVIVAALEWAAWRSEPHYGSGLPPRYYVPTVNLPPARPLEQVPAGYPEAQRDEAPTWIASAALRAEMLGEWPHSAPVDEEAGSEEELSGEPPVLLPPPLQSQPVLPQPVQPQAVQPQAVQPQAAESQTTAADPTLEPELEPAAVAVELPAADEPGEPTEEPATEPESSFETHSEPQPEPQVELAPALHDVVVAHSARATARYSLDPLAEPPVKRRFGRGGTPEPLPVVEVPARPDGVRPLPGHSSRQD